MEKGNISEREIIKRIREGEIDHFAFLVKEHTSRILNYIKSRLFVKDDADDLVQNTFLSFYKALDRFDENRKVLPYLYEIAKNELKMYYRQHKETAPLYEDMQGEGFDDQVYALGDIDEIMKEVPPVQRRALELVVEGYSYKEISEKMNKNINTVRTLIRRARQLLSSKYSK